VVALVTALYSSSLGLVQTKAVSSASFLVSGSSNLVQGPGSSPLVGCSSQKYDAKVDRKVARVCDVKRESVRFPSQSKNLKIKRVVP